MNRSSLHRGCLRISLVLGVAAALAGCGGSSSSSSSTTTTTTVTLSTTANSHPVVVDGQPLINGVYTGAPNALYTSIGICVPGTTTCQTVFNVQVDTGSSGLRLRSSALYIPLTNNKDASGNSLANCGRFSDGSVQWGAVQPVDLNIEGEIASSLPVQVIGGNSIPAAPAGCVSGVITERPPLVPGANGILGIGMRKQDCGAACAASPAPSPAAYFSCTASQCVPTPVPVANQLQNPVAMFPQDNNGVILQMPGLGDSGTNFIAGSLLFGIATQSTGSNFLGTAQIQTPDANGHFTTVYNGVNYTSSYFASGARAIYFPPANTTGLVSCTTAATAGFYCPPSPVGISTIIKDVNSVSSNIPFSVGNAASLFQLSFGQNRAFNNLTGPTSINGFVWGLPFFYGRNIFIAIEGQTVTTSALTATVTSTTGPFIAY